MQVPTFVNNLNDQTLAELLRQLPHNDEDTKEIISFIAIHCCGYVRRIMDIITYVKGDSGYISENTELNIAYLLDCIDGETSGTGTSNVEMTKALHERISERKAADRW